MSVELRWNGLEAKKSIEAQLQKALLESAIVVRKNTVPITPILTGNLRRSVTVSSNLLVGQFVDETTGRSETIRPKKNVSLVGTIVKYASNIERKRSFLGAGFVASQAKIKTLFLEILKRSEFIQ